MSDPATIDEMLRRARASTDVGDDAAARQAWGELLAVQPTDITALSALALVEFRSGALTRSAELLDRALAIRPHDPTLLRNRAAVRAAAGEWTAAVATQRAAAAAQPTACLPLLELGLMLARSGALDEAVRSMRAAWAIEPRIVDPDAAATLPAPLPELARAARAVGREWLEARVTQAFAEVRERHGNAVDISRVAAALRAYQGYSANQYRHPLQRTRTLYLPELEPRVWYEREEFPWAAALEAETAAIRAELLAVADQGGGAEPYITRAPDGSEAWRALAGKDAWSSFFLYKEAARVATNCARTPATERSVLAVPTARSHGAPGEVFFSMLKPRTLIPPHHGLTNTKLVVHLPLVIPPDCYLTAGGEQRSWVEGRLLAFDDSFLHQARNGSDALRAVLIFEVWNPGLAPHECEAVAGVLDAIADLDRL